MPKYVSEACIDCGIPCQIDRYYLAKVKAKGSGARCRSCRSARMSMQRRGYNKRGGIVTVNCAICEREISRDRYDIERVKLAVTCSLACCYEARRRRLIAPTKPMVSGPENPLWEGKIYRKYGSNWHVQRDAAKHRDGYACKHCGTSEHAHGRALEVHHIVRLLDFDSTEAANVLTNLITLCTKCHRKADSELYRARKAAQGYQVPPARIRPG